MKKLLVIISIIIVMLLFPLCAIMFVSPDASLIAILLMFYIINPMFSIVIGIVSGLEIKRMWWSSLLLPASFIASGYLILKTGHDCLIYSLVYFILHFISMLITSILKYNKDRKS